MGWIGCVRCEKFRHAFVAQTFALIALVQLVLHQVLCSNETIPNTPKHYETHQNMGLVSNGVDRVHSMWKIATRIHGTNFCVNCTSSTHFAPSFMQLLTIPNAPKHYETHQNMSLGSNGVNMVHSLRKILTPLHGTNFCVNWTSSANFAQSFML